jgi:hypothetical protein
MSLALTLLPHLHPPPPSPSRSFPTRFPLLSHVPIYPLLLLRFSVMADSWSFSGSSARDREEDRRHCEFDLEMREHLQYKIEFLYF